ncbi:hypothetical protein DFH07DRAFT_821360 [Mycena maculata]|uniref:Uncharacterized protein n=1 Tax=Mycena maculata TaxID=230809 RepID=A0AAD7J4V5_9AGAR|nr:hypothetical protein DFH07DRAFT_821360 [Mycena maculata]
MRFFGTSERRHHRAFYRRDPNRAAGGYKAALANPRTTRAGRKNAKAELHAMGRSAHVPLMIKIKRALGIRKTKPPRHSPERKVEARREREYEPEERRRERRGTKDASVPRREKRGRREYGTTERRREREYEEDEY